MDFVFFTLEETYLDALEAAREIAQDRAGGLPLRIKAYTVAQLNVEAVRQEAARAIAAAPVIVASMLFFEEHVRPVADLLIAAPPTSAIAAINCAPELMQLTHLGGLRLGGEGWANRLLQRARPRQKRGAASDRPDSGRLALGLVRSLPRLLKLVPGTSRDLRRYLLLLQYWTHGTPENLANMLLMLAQGYGDHEARARLASLRVPDPVIMPQAAIFHPDAAAPFTSAADYRRWRNEHGLAVGRAAAGTVGLLSLRSTVLAGNMDHIAALIRELERRGLEPIPAYAGGLDMRAASRRFFAPQDGAAAGVDVLFNLSGFALVGGMAHNEAALAAAELRRIGRPVLTGVPLNFQTLAAWRESRTGLNPVQIAMQAAIPELEGAIEPLVYGGMPTPGARRYEPEPENVAVAAGRLAGWARLVRKDAAQRRVAIVLFNFPPNGGAVGSAAYLAVFPSLFRVLEELQREGYALDLPRDADELRRQLVEGNRLEFGTPANVAAALSVADYRRLAPWHGEITAYWGQPPGAINSDGEQLLILGREYGNVFVGVQPPFGFEGDPMKLLMAEGITPHHGFAAFYRWLDGTWGADALLHFGTHGALEFMPGKQAGLSASCWPVRLVGDLPHLYLYSANNPSEGSIARRRGLATLVSYLSPPLEQAGLYRGLADLKPVVRDALASGAPGRAALEAIALQAESLKLDWRLPDNAGQTRAALEVLYNQLLDLERRIIPTGLHEVGAPPAGAELAALLGAVAAHERQELGLPALPGLIAGATRHDAMSDEVQAIAAEAMRLVVADDAAASADYLARAGVRPEAARPMLDWLAELAGKLGVDAETPSLVAALAGRYIEPSPGADVVRNPASAPTGRNIHALDPYTLPTATARVAARHTVAELLTRSRQGGAAWPRAVALVLWGTDNLKTGGEGIAQALELLGVEPTSDSLGRVSGVRLRPLVELGRPRLDVVLTCSGIFRDLMPNAMALLDRAVRLAAEADEPAELNFVRANCLAEFARGRSWDDATARVFSNAPGAYGANVNFLVESSAWEDEAALAETFMARKSFAYGRAGEGVAARGLLEAALRQVELTFQNVDSIETGLSDIDHYFEYLGGVTRSVQQLAGQRPAAYVLDVQGMGGRVRTLGEMVEIESRTKLLNPKWSTGMLRFGYEGVREIGVRVANTLGWSATTAAVPGWIYSDLTEVYVGDSEMRRRMSDLNPVAYSGLVGRLLEAAGREYWQPDAVQAELLRRVYGEAEDLAEQIA